MKQELQTRVNLKIKLINQTKQYLQIKVQQRTQPIKATQMVHAQGIAQPRTLHPPVRTRQIGATIRRTPLPPTLHLRIRQVSKPTKL